MMIKRKSPAVLPGKQRYQVTFPVACRKTLYAACGLVWFSNAYASCKVDGLPLTPAMINDFLQKPEIILGDDAGSKRGARKLSFSISQYAATGSAAIQAIKSILPSATLQQRAAIGEGLYKAVAFCRAIDPLTATRIEIAVNSIGDKEVTLAYRRAANLSGPATGNSKPKSFSGLASAKPLAPPPGLIGTPSPNDPGSLKLSDPFGSPDVWR
jgi:hypothetical protein